MRNPRTKIPSRLTIAGLTLLATLLLSAPSAHAAGGCPNEAVRAESNPNPLTGQPYDMGLPECRAYEMVSPLEKQQHDALTIGEPTLVSASPEGNAIEWAGQGDYAEAENYEVDVASPTNPYVAQRTASGWVTRSAYAPPTLIEYPGIAFGGSGVYSPNLADETVCGGTASTGGNGEGPAIRCALRDPSGLWSGTPEYLDLTGQTFTGLQAAGASRNGEDYVFYGADGVPFVSSDTSSTLDGCNGDGHCGGIYEVTGIGTASTGLHLVNVDNDGNMIGPENPNDVGSLPKEPDGGDYQAVSVDGSKIFFTATPSGGVPTVYARVDNSETVAISNPSPAECTTCNPTPTKATYWGASANGEKVFFTTTEQLLNSDTDEENDLYEYDFNSPGGHELTQVSAGGLGDVTPGAEAKVEGVVAVSEDGSHVYFVAQGALTTLPDGLGQTAGINASNLYAYDTETGETRFVATLPETDDQLWGFSHLSGSGAIDVRFAQTTPDGRYLVFDTSAELIATGPEADTSGALQVYRYDFKTGRIVRVSEGHEGFADNGNVPGFDAVIGPGVSNGNQATPTVDDADRTISENGETIAFVSAAQLQSTDVAAGPNKSCNDGSAVDDGAGCEVYVWHECPHGACADGDSGEVDMVSEGVDPGGVLYAGMSASASDIFFQTRSQLVGQDTDHLGDIYDARIDGGFPAPVPEPSCPGEACQGAASPAPAFAAPGTAGVSGGVNDIVPPFKEPDEPAAKPKSKPLTSAQKLSKALEQCRRDKTKSKRERCEKAARKRYGANKVGKKKEGRPKPSLQHHSVSGVI